MNCLTKEELTMLFLGQLNDETAASMYAHIAICSHCSERYSQIAEGHLEAAPKDFSSDILRQIAKGPITRRKLLAIYAVAAACVMMLVTSGGVDKLFTITKQMDSQSIKWSQKFNQSKFNQIWEDHTHGIQN